MILSALLLAALGVRVSSLHDRATESPARPAQGEIAEDEALFSGLLRAGLITKDPDGICLVLAPRDRVLFKKTEQGGGNGNTELAGRNPATEERLLKALYNSSPGLAIQGEVRLWNQAHRFAAIRDNRSRPGKEAHNEWHAYSGRELVPTGGFVPETFGFINAGRLRPGFGDWSVAVPLMADVEFRTRLHLTRRTLLEVQLIGGLIRTVPNAQVVQRCGGEGSPCTPASSILFSLEPGTHELKVVASPGTDRTNILPGLSIYRDFKSGDFKWRSSPPARFLSPPPPLIKTADGTLLSDPNGRPTEFTEKAGLLPLVGFGPQAAYALLGLLSSGASSAAGGEVRLTIEAGIQEKAQRVLEKRITEFWPADSHYGEERRGALVVLDVDTGAILAVAGYPQPPPGTHPWDLLSFARVYPVKNPLIVRAWQGLDEHCAPGSSFKPVVALAALKTSEKQKSLLEYLRGYGIGEFQQRSGLTLDCSAYEPESGRSFPANRIPADVRQKISNFESGSIRAILQRNHQGSCVGSSSWSRPDFGLREGIRDSVNVWFARLAVLMDGDKAKAYASARGISAQAQDGSIDLHLTQMARVLGFGEDPMDLASNTKGIAGIDRRAFRKGEWEGRRRIGAEEGDVLYGHPGVSDLVFARQLGLDPLWGLAQNSIGQGMTASPLQMARVAASIASGKVVQPYVLSHWGERKLDPPAQRPLDVREELVDALREAMKTVPDTGTAQGAFRAAKHPDLCRVFGKTGTANVGGSGGRFWSTWFVGWREPRAPGQRRLAFACMVTHAHGAHRNTGGGVSAPIVADLLRELP